MSRCESVCSAERNVNMLPAGHNVAVNLRTAMASGVHSAARLTNTPYSWLLLATACTRKDSSTGLVVSLAVRPKPQVSAVTRYLEGPECRKQLPSSVPGRDRLL